MHKRKMRRKGMYKGIPYLVIAALAAGFMLGVPRISAISAVAQVDKAVISRDRKPTFPMLAGYIGRTNSVISRGFMDGDFTFTGSYTWWDDGDGNWKLKFTSSGIFIPLKDVSVDVFVVGGGGGGRGGQNTCQSGGGGGRTGTWTNIALTSGTPYEVIVGAGGNVNGTGGTSSFIDETYSKAGGSPGRSGSYNWDGVTGGSGGSGGGSSGNYADSTARGGGAGGADGGNGGTVSQSPAGGAGQGSTTREFGEPNGDLYAGGGGGGAYSTSKVGGAGGAGGGGRGGGSTGGTAGQDNTGGGGGGGVRNGGGTKGGSGIVIIRNAR